jgi:prepilin-type N-terminal cleavage/methylation domain-containing protein
MKHRSKSRLRSMRGFTIIEVLIVLAIVGVVLMTILLALPAVKRNSRDIARKHLAEVTASEMDEYYTTHGLSYPNDPTTMCTFIKAYLEDETGAQPACNATYVASKDCVLVKGKRYSVCYHDLSSSHGYEPPFDEVSIQLGHWCNQGTGYYSGDGTNPLTAGPGGSPPHQLKRYTVWVTLEGSSDPLCFDNYAN